MSVCESARAYGACAEKAVSHIKEGQESRENEGKVHPNVETAPPKVRIPAHMMPCACVCVCVWMSG